MPNDDDSQLISQYRNGQVAALEILVNRHFKLVYRFVYRLVKDEATASDLTQTTFIKAWQNLQRFDANRSFKTWLLTIAKNSALDELRRKPAFTFSQLSSEADNLNDSELLADPSPLPPAIFAQKELGLKLNNYLDELSFDEKTVILLHLEDDLTFAEIAESLGKPLNSVKSQYRRALLKLRQKLTLQAPN